jgi:uncharacterized cofD-like protein
MKTLSTPSETCGSVNGHGLKSVGDPRIVAIGGGTGLPIVLEGLKQLLYPDPRSVRSDGDQDRLTAVVTVADDGGSSGRLRQVYGVLPPGDIRNCLLALADRNSTLAALFNYRFDGGDEIGGHSLGNLILTALSCMEEDFSKAIERGSEILDIRGRVLPSTTEDIRLRAHFEDGSSIEGESRISSVPQMIRRVSIEPADAAPLPQTLEAVSRANVVVIGPGSLYTSLIPVLLVKGLKDAIRQSDARVVLVMNLTTEPGETDGYTAVDHLIAIRRHAPDMPIHDVLLNATPVPDEQAQAYSLSGATPVEPNVELLSALGHRPLLRDLLGTGPKIRHDAHKLAGTILQILHDARAGVDRGPIASIRRVSAVSAE